MWGHYDGHGWWMVVSILMMVVFWIGIVAVFYLVSGNGRIGGRWRDDEQAIDVLDRRFASGEINEAEYDRIRQRLNS